MNREILFRGKRIDNKKWTYGYYAVIGARHAIIKAQAEDYYSVDDSVKKSRGNEIIEVDPETVCQYTGLTDKNRLQKIFECDIINENGERIGNVCEKENIQPGTSYITIARMGTKEWEDTKQERDRCGLRYA